MRTNDTEYKMRNTALFKQKVDSSKFFTGRKKKTAQLPYPLILFFFVSAEKEKIERPVFLLWRETHFCVITSHLYITRSRIKETFIRKHLQMINKQICTTRDSRRSHWKLFIPAWLPLNCKDNRKIVIFFFQIKLMLKNKLRERVRKKNRRV